MTLIKALQFGEIPIKFGPKSIDKCPDKHQSVPARLLINPQHPPMPIPYHQSSPTITFITALHVAQPTSKFGPKSINKCPGKPQTIPPRPFHQPTTPHHDHHLSSMIPYHHLEHSSTAG